MRAAHPGLDIELVPMSTRGDEVLDRSLAAIGGKGLFLKELEVAMQRGQADCAVHSLKDVPTEMPEGLVLGAIGFAAAAVCTLAIGLTGAIAGFAVIHGVQGHQGRIGDARAGGGSGGR